MVFLFILEQSAPMGSVVQLDTARKAFQTETIEIYQEDKASSVPVSKNNEENGMQIKKRAE
jgi:hypothetical protein